MFGTGYVSTSQVKGRIFEVHYDPRLLYDGRHYYAAQKQPKRIACSSYARAQQRFPVMS